MLKSGDPTRKILFVLYDSRVATQEEAIQLAEMKSIIPRIYAEEQNFQVVKVDVSKDTLPDDFPISSSKVSIKNSPSVFIRANDSLHRLRPNVLENLGEFNKSLNKLTQVKEVKNVRDLSEALKENNKKLDDLTILYCEDADTQDKEETARALRILKHESQFQILKVTDSVLSKAMRLKPGKYYCYYKPSFINGYEAPMNQDMNFEYL